MLKTQSFVELPEQSTHLPEGVKLRPLQMHVDDRGNIYRSASQGLDIFACYSQELPINYF